MPRGNDTEYAVDFDKRVQEQYGIHPNAQALIDAHRASRDPGVLRAGMTQINLEATEEANEDLEATAGKFDDPEGDLVSAAVRGNALIGVFLDPVTGAYTKHVAPWTDAYKPPTITQEQAEERAAYLREEHVRVETERLKLEAEDTIAQARAEANARIAEQLTQISEEADATLADAKAQAAQKAEEARAAAEEAEREAAQKAEDANAGQIAEGTQPEPPDTTGATPPLDPTTIGQVDTPPVDPSQVPPSDDEDDDDSTTSPDDSSAPTEDPTAPAASPDPTTPSSGDDDDSAPETVDESNGNEVKATSAAIQAAQAAGIDIGAVTGTGKDGTITKADVDRAIQG